jgi:hypothetical protein
MAESTSVYTDAQSNEILRTAVRLAARDEITFEELAAAGKELGISREEMLEAETKYRHQISEAGLRQEFGHMQRKELQSYAFHISVYALIGFLIVWLDFEVPAVTALVIAAGMTLAIVAMKGVKIFRDSADAEAKFRDLQAKKRIWLRPERSKQLTEQCLSNPPTLYEKLSQWSPQEIAVKRLIRKFSFDKKRANEVADAYFREHPEAEEQLNA